MIEMSAVTIKWKQGYDPTYSPYGATGSHSFTWVKIVSKNKLEQTSAWHSCRETFTSVIHKFIYPTVGYKSEVNIKKLMMGVIKRYPADINFDKEVIRNEKEIKASIRCINIVEKYLGWSLSKIRKIKNKELPKSYIDGYFITGSPKWLRSPPLLSFYLLLIKAGVYHNTLSKVNSIYDLEAIGALPEFSTAQKASSQNECIFDKNGVIFKWYKSSHKRFVPFIENVHKLFFNKTIRDNYSIYKTTDGVFEFCNGNIMNPQLKCKWETILKERVRSQ